jgi:hypothetical protein
MTNYVGGRSKMKIAKKWSADEKCQIDDGGGTECIGMRSPPVDHERAEDWHVPRKREGEHGAARQFGCRTRSRGLLLLQPVA